jgi:hypothetical protein
MALERAQHSPRDPNVLNNVGVLSRAQGHAAVAEVWLRRAVSLAPHVAAYHSNLGNALRDLGRYGEAVDHLTQATALDPGSSRFAYNLALAVRDLGRWDEAVEMLESLARSHPEDSEIEWDLALSRLADGDFARGFRGYEARLRLDRFPSRPLAGVRWMGGDLTGKTLFVRAEQGFGDMLQFVRFIPELVGRGARVILESDPSLAPLFAEIEGVAQVVPRQPAGEAAEVRLPGYDLWVPMGSLPHLLEIDAPALERQRFPYLKTSRHLTAPLPRPRGARLAVGLVWPGKIRPSDRSWPLASLLPLLHDPDVAYYSLQIGPRAADLGRLGANGLIMDVGSGLKSFADTAAVMADLDLMISIDSAPVHLAGALGVPTFVLLRNVADWRWGRRGERTPWYPSVELFRQRDADDFDGPVRAIAARLKDLVA